MSDQWEEGRRQLKINRVGLAKRNLADSAKEILKTTNLGRTTIANARAVAGRTATIPVKNMNKSLALEKPPSTSSKIARVGRGLLRGAGIIGAGFFAKDIHDITKQAFNEAFEHGKKRGIRHRRKLQIPKAKYVSNIINSTVRKIKDR